MDTLKVSKILERHGIPFCIDNGRIFADSMVNGTKTFENTIDLTNFTVSELYSWLGY